MKLKLLMFSYSCFLLLSFGQLNAQTFQPTVSTPVYFDISPPLRDIPIQPPFQKDTIKRNPGLQFRDYPNAANAFPKGPDEAWQKEMGTLEATDGPTINFEGVGNRNSVIPPDTQGDVGPNHYFQVVNNSYQIWDKLGNSLLGPSDLTTIWTGIAISNITDPVVLYDEQADRWFVSVFKSSSPYKIYIAVSQTGDPTGSWYRWVYDWATKPDYAKYGVWRDGYYYASNTSGGKDVGVFERSVMLTGGASPQLVSFTNGNRPNVGFHCIQPLDNDGAFAPAGTPGQFVTINDDSWSGSDQLWIYQLAVNWTTPGSSTFSRTQLLSVTAFDSNFGPNWDNIAQPGTAQELDAVPEVLMYRAQYRNFGSYQTLVCCHSVDVDNTDHAGVRWYELRKTGATWSVYQQSTYAPDANSRWMGSIAMNSVGDIALGYSVSSSTVYPSIRFTGRKAGDALNTMTLSESSIFAGTASQTGWNRWGDYACMTVDPTDNVRFWYTNEYSLGGANWHTRVAAFSFSKGCYASGGCDEYIGQVQAGSINNITGCINYGDYTLSHITNLPVNGVLPVTVTNGHPYIQDQCGIWVDWNRDGDFWDANETITVSGNPGNGPYTANVFPPAGQTLGQCTMRIRITYTGAVDPCGTTAYGEVEDYTINLTGPANNIWTGAISNNWHDPGNWNLLHVPYSTDNVIISNVPNPCWIYLFDASCNDVDIMPGTYLRNYNRILTINGSLYAQGQLMMDLPTASAQTYVLGGVYWLSGSTAWLADLTTLGVFGHMEFLSGSNVQVNSGSVIFYGTNTTYIRCYQANTALNNVSSNKTGGAEFGFSGLSSQDLIINGNLYVQTNSRFVSYTSRNLFVKGDILCNGVFNCTAGTVILDGVNQTIMPYTGGYFSNLTFSQTGTVSVNATYTNILDVNGNVQIESGVLNLQDRTMNVGGNWTNTAGISAFNEGTSRVIFDGPGHQLVKSNETFNILEAKMGAALRIEDPAGFTVTCNLYDWTSGGIDVVKGTFNALDLADNGLFGTFWCNPGGTLNLTQDIGQYPDLHGEIHIFGGTMTVTGGLGQSYWPYFDNATIEMSGGILDFKNNGIYFYNGGNTLTENITGGTIRTNGSFTGDRADFTPTGGTIELYGSPDTYLSHGLGSNLMNLLINKSASKDNLSTNEEEIFYDREGNMTNGTRANGVSSTSDLVLFGNMTIQAGTLSAPSSIKLKGNWTNNVGTAGFTEGTGVVTFNNNDHQYCYGETFYGLELNKPAMDLYIPAGTTTTCQIYDWNNGELEVDGGTFIAYDLFDNGLYGRYFISYQGGLMELHQDASQFIDLNGRIVIAAGTMNIYGGNGYSYWPFDGNADLWMSGGVLDFKDNGVYLNSSNILNEQITGGTIRVNKGFYGDRTDFNPAGGTLELYGNTDVYLGLPAGSTLNEVIINKNVALEDGSISPNNTNNISEKTSIPERKPILEPGSKSSSVSAIYNPNITGNLTINSGTFILGGTTVNVGLNTIINTGTLQMTLPTDKLVSVGVYWNAGSNDNINNGEIDADYWAFYNGTNASLSVPNLSVVKYSINPEDPDAQFGHFRAAGSAKSGKSTDAYYPVRVSGNCTFSSGANWFSLVDWIIAGNLSIEAAATLDLQGGSDMPVAGSFSLAGSLTESSGTVVTIQGDFIFPNTGVLNVNQGTFINNFNGGVGLLSGTLQLSTGTVEFPNRSISLNNTFTDMISGGLFRFGQTFAATPAGVFQPTGGNVEFINASSGNYIQVTGDNYFNNLTINKPGSSLQVYDNIVINGDLNINAGVLNSNNKTIQIAGNWYNNLGVSGFDETSGRVIFNGTGNQFCSTENFNILEINKPSNLLYNVPNSTINCQVYDWTSGGIWISPGNFTAADLADPGLFGTFAIYNGTMDLHQDIGNYADLNGNIYVGASGTLNVYGGNGLSWWPYYGNATVTMNGGVLDFKDVGIYVNNNATNTFSENITGGTIRTSGVFVSTNANFTPVGGTAELYGGISASISSTLGSYFNNVTINKSGGVKDDNGVSYTGRDSQFINSTRANDVVLYDDALINGSLSVSAGKLSTGLLGYDLICMGPVNIANGASMELQESSILKLNNSLIVNSGGTFRSLGSAAFAIITRAAVNPYLFSVLSGGNFGANNTIFEYMGANGINIASGALVDPSQAFNNCTFRQGIAGNTLLTINSSQDLVSTGAVFPANTWGGSKNVTKSVNSGYMTFGSYTGAFGGATFESDPNNRVEWYTTTPTQTVSIPAGWSGLSSFIMPSETNLPALFTPIAANFTMLQNLTGMYYPAGSINTIGPWVSKSAYSIKLNAASTLPVTGLPEHNKSFNLAGGWNMLPVICNTNVTTSTLVSGLGASLQIMKEVAGNKLYWPAFGIYTLDQLTPGKAYFVRMGAPGSVIFPNNVADNFFIPDEPIKELATPWNSINRTSVSHIIGIESEGMQDIKDGDILGVFTTDGLCAGNVQITDLNQNHALYAFADDPLTPEPDGFTDGQPMIFRLYRPSTEEVFQLDVVLDMSMPDNNGMFASEGISAIQSITTVITGVNEQFANGLYIYPNPTSGDVTIGGIEGIEQILVLTTDGNAVLKMEPKAGGDQLLKLTALPTGLYQVQIRSSQGTIFRKVVKGL